MESRINIFQWDLGPSKGEVVSRSGIYLDPVLGVRNRRAEILNAMASWIPLHRATLLVTIV